MAVLHARGLMAPGDAMSHASVIGTVFDGRIVSTARIGEHDGIIPAVRGSAWITGLHQFMLDPSDPFPEGYLVADTWGVSGADTQAPA
jgi:proline racemase